MEYAGSGRLGLGYANRSGFRAQREKQKYDQRKNRSLNYD